MGVALFGSNVNFVLFVLKFSGCFMFNHVHSVVCFLLSVLSGIEPPGVGDICEDLFSLLSVFVCIVPRCIIFSVFPVFDILSNFAPWLSVYYLMYPTACVLLVFACWFLCRTHC